MYFSKKIFNGDQEGIKLSEFLSKNYKAVVILLLAFLTPTISEAATNTDMILKAFDPLMDVFQAISLPVATLMILGGFLLVIIGQRHKGIQMIKWSSVGYIGVQFVPAIMRILYDVGRAMQKAQ